jgi:hypothetical protein
MDTAVITPAKNKKQHSMNEKTAYDMGYRYLGGKVYGPDRKERVLTLSVKNYLRFSIRANGKKKIIPLHRFIAYQEHGMEIYNHHCIRHLDGNSLNNKISNLALGSQRDNLMDIPPDVRSDKARNAIMARWGLV